METLSEVISEVDDTVASIGITNQRETIVAWSKSTGRPLHRAIVWQDRRTAEYCDSLVEHLPLVRRTTGLVLDPYFSGSKARWLITEGNVSPSDDLALGTIDSWIIWNLTNGASFVTDVSNASRTMLFDINSCRWSSELCALLEVPMNALPAVVPSSGVCGATSVAGLPNGIPIAGIAGDQQSALFGQACFSPGMAKNTYGTGSFVLMNVGTTCPPPTDGMLTTVAWDLGRGETTYALEGAVFVTGAAVQWLRDGLGIIESSADIGPLASTVPDNGGVFVVPAFTGLGSPWWDPYARGTIVGITRGTTRAHVARAVVEAMVFQTRDVVEAMTAASGTPLAELRVDGGAAVMNDMLQMQSDELGVPVLRPTDSETTALGAAYLAGLGTGVWNSMQEIADAWRLDRRFDPRAESGNYSTWLRAVERSRSWVRH
jgi:glycerol kinase